VEFSCAIWMDAPRKGKWDEEEEEEKDRKDGHIAYSLIKIK